MANKETILRFVQEGAADLEAYLLSDILYWQLHAPAGRQRFTLGGMLLGLMKIKSLGEASGEAEDLFSLQEKIDKVKVEHQTAWEKKASQETAARIRLWKTFLEDYRQNPDDMAAYYPREVKWRVLIQLLLKELPKPIDQVDLLTLLDTMVKSNWLPGGFIWEPYLVNAMPAREYWFLYGGLKP